MTPHADHPAIHCLRDSLLDHHPGRRGESLAVFAREMHARTSDKYLSRYSVEQLADGIVSMFDWLESSPGDRFSIRIIRPDWLTSTSSSRYWAIEVTGPDQPFLVDSLRELMRVKDYSAADAFHPIIAVTRDAEGHIESVREPGTTGDLVSFIHIEVSGEIDDSAVESLQEEAELVFAEARCVAVDFSQMISKLRATIAGLHDRMSTGLDGPASQSASEAADFLDWLQSSNFVFLGAREYRLKDSDDGPMAYVVPNSGLGILRDASISSLATPTRIEDLSPEAHRRIENEEPLSVYKTNSESRVLRRARMDYISLRLFDSRGRLSGEQRFLGLFTARALGELPARIPILRRKLQQIIQQANVVPGSHDHKELFSTFCALPKAQLFLYENEALSRLIFQIIETRGRDEVRVHYHSDPYDLSVSVMVLLPRERFDADMRREVQKLLTAEFEGTIIEYHLALSDEPLARLHFFFATKPGHTKQPAITDLEAKVRKITRTWRDRVVEELRRRYEVGKGTYMAERFAGAFPASYIAQESPETAAEDITLLERAFWKGRPLVKVGRCKNSRGEENSTIKIVRIRKPYHLSRLMPTLTHLGLDILDESTYRIDAPKAGIAYLHCFRALGSRGQPVPEDETARRLEETIRACLEAWTVDDDLNALVPLGGMAWSEIAVIRAYTAYLQQLEPALQEQTAFQVLRRYPEAARSMWKLFDARFRPGVNDDERREKQELEKAALEKFLDSVDGIQDDHLLRAVENLILATVRTNYFRSQVPPDEDAFDSYEEPASALGLKICCADVISMPLPRPEFEIFVHSPEMEGVHLRSGKIARGGIRWSDRLDDYRTEILGLMKAQRTKNALIVPVGAKGGFVLKSDTAASGLRQAVEDQYRVFITTLLELTDNVVEGEVKHPDDTVIYDVDDPYLVVAADRGTATFSDLANSIAQDKSFWLHDAFASGGSTGYNHKEFGITAAGAWECVKRSFLRSNFDIQTQDFTTVGIGDMSGDVFGNGMLLSRHIRLVAAFNHEHIFVDPNPDAANSHEERKRLFALPRSRWSDYDAKLISPGGGLFSRQAKRITLSRPMKDLLGTTRDKLNGDELVHAILRLPVDLLWNGGIGTYVKASFETHFDVGDPHNDGVRVDASELRARVFGEGGNLGITQRGRNEFARQGGLINTDFIDNSGGVDLSDHEVNLKILLGVAITRDRLKPEARDETMREVADEICTEVLRDNRRQCDLLTLEELRSASELAQLRWLIGQLEGKGWLQREVEAIPEERQLDSLAESGLGLSRPQLSVLLAFAKIDAYTDVIETNLAEHADFAIYREKYFPASITERFSEEISLHPLKYEITMTLAVNDCINRMGIAFLHRLARDENKTMGEVLHAYAVTSDLADASRYFLALDTLFGAQRLDLDAWLDSRTRFARRLERAIRQALRLGTFSDERSARLISLAGSRGTHTISGSSQTLEKWADDAEELLDRVESLGEDIETVALASLQGVDPKLARQLLAAAGERILAADLALEIERSAKLSISDWQMASALSATLQELRSDLAIDLHTTLDGASNMEEEGRLEALNQTAMRRVSDDNPLRMRVQSSLRQSQSEQPLTLSEVFVLVENVRQILATPGPSNMDKTATGEVK